jgi:putative tributyrin esterase
MIKSIIKILILFFLIFNSYAQTDNGYAIKKAETNYGIGKTVKSKALKKDMPVLVFLPASYASSKKNYPVVYMLHGVNGMPLTEEGLRKMNNSGTKILEAADFFQVIIVTPIVGNTFYMNSPKDTTQKIASYVGEDLPNFIDSEFRTIKNREGRFLAGFSMGGHGAVSLLCRYPETFSVALSRGGLMDLAAGVVDLQWDDAAWPVDILGSYFTNQQRYHLNSCINLSNKIAGRKDVAIVLEVGREDMLYKCNKRFEKKLSESDIPYIYAEYPGGHVWSSACLMSMLGHLQAFRKTVLE